MVGFVFQKLLIRSGLYFCVFLVFLPYCIQIFILIIQTLLKFRNKLLFNQFVEPRENANILEVVFYFVMRAFWGLGKFFNQIVNLWLLATPLVTPLATPYIFFSTTLSKILDPPLLPVYLKPFRTQGKGKWRDQNIKLQINHAPKCRLTPQRRELPKTPRKLTNTPLGEGAKWVLSLCRAPFVRKLFWLFDITKLNHEREKWLFDITKLNHEREKWLFDITTLNHEHKNGYFK